MTDEEDEVRMTALSSHAETSPKRFMKARQGYSSMTSFEFDIYGNSENYLGRIVEQGTDYCDQK
jgi:hypothetical protein